MSEEGDTGPADRSGERRSLAPSVARRQLGAELRALRGRAGMRLGDVAPIVQLSAATISRLERGESERVRIVDVRALLELFASRIDGLAVVAVEERLLHFAEEARKRDWLHDFRDVLTGGAAQLQAYVEFESIASTVLVFEPELVPGLLQTPQYAEAIMAMYYTSEMAVRRRRLVDFRMARKRSVAGTRFEAVIGELALRRPLGGPEVMAGQLEYLVDRMDAGNAGLRVQVAPLRMVSPEVIGGPFVVMRFDAADEQDLVYFEGRYVGPIRREDELVREYADHFRVMQREVLDPAGSRDLVVRLIDWHRSGASTDGGDFWPDAER